MSHRNEKFFRDARELMDLMTCDMTPWRDFPFERIGKDLKIHTTIVKHANGAPDISEMSVCPQACPDYRRELPNGDAEYRISGLLEKVEEET